MTGEEGEPTTTGEPARATDDESEPTTTADEGELERSLGFVEAMTLGGGTMIGAGIFVLPGIAAEHAGPASAVSFAIAGIVALLAALSLSELATGMPVAGGSYHYVNRALGGFFGSVVGWGMWTGLMFASAFYMIGFGQYLVGGLPLPDRRALIVLLGLAGLALLVVVNYHGTEKSSRLQNVMIGTETAIVICYVIVGLAVVDPGNLEPFAPTGASGIVATTGIVFVSFLGFEIVATVAGEVRDPGWTIPVTMTLSVVLVTILYVFVMIVSTGVVPYEALGGSLVPVSDVAAVAAGTVGVVAIVFAAVIAAISSSNSSILAASRVLFAMGRDDLMSGWLNASHERFHTPHRAILATGGVTTLLIALGLRVEAIVALLAEVASFSFLLSYALVHVAVVVFRRADPDEYDPAFEIPDPLYPLVPALGVLATVVVVSQMARDVVLLGTGVAALGVTWYLAYADGRPIETGLLEEALGRGTSGDPREVARVLVPIANPETQGGLLRLAAASARAGADGRQPELVAVNVVEGDPDSGRQNVASERLAHQRQLLESARDVAASMDVDLRTRALVGRHPAETLLAVIEEEAPDQVLLGWRGRPSDDGEVFSETIDPVVAASPCEVSLVTLADGPVGRPVALVGEGPHAPVAARRAREFATVDGTTPTLLRVERPVGEGTDDAGGEGTDDDAAERGTALVEAVADAAGLDPAEYDHEVVVAEDAAAAIREATDGFDTVCLGLSEERDAGRIAFGSITERVTADARGNVVVVRGADEPLRATDRSSTAAEVAGGFGSEPGGSAEPTGAIDE